MAQTHFTIHNYNQDQGNREGSTLARRKWQPPHNAGTPQTMKHIKQTLKHTRQFLNRFKVNHGRRNAIETEKVYLAARLNHCRGSRPMWNWYEHPRPGASEAGISWGGFNDIIYYSLTIIGGDFPLCLNHGGDEYPPSPPLLTPLPKAQCHLLLQRE